MTERESTIEEMLVEVKRIRESLAELSESAKTVTEAIRGVLGDDINHAYNTDWMDFKDNH